jgi:ABC-type histidine transport system ATPase subunit
LRQADQRRTNFATTEDELEANDVQFARILTGIELALGDAPVVGRVLAAMQQLASDGMTMVVVIHEMSFARDIADRIAFMGGVSSRRANLTSSCSRRRTARVRAFLRRYNDRYRI